VPKRFLILSRDFSIDGGELTPKLSVRRRVVEERHREGIERLYAAPASEAAEEAVKGER
jgi:long-chain acyl-CoA synthetase